MNEKEKSMLVSEVNILRELKHVNIVRYKVILLLRSSLVRSSLELGLTKVYAPGIRALLGPAAHFSEVGVLQVRTVPIGSSQGHPARANLAFCWQL